MAAILQAIDHHVATSGDDARVTRIATTANLAYDRLIGYLEEMVRAGLVTEVRKPRLTPEGREVLQRYTTLTEMLSRFGLR